jgi:hypothetical protein
VPQLGVTEDEHERRDALGAGAHHVGGDHQRPRGAPIRDHAAPEEQCDQRNLAGGEDETDAGSVRDLQDGEHKSDRRDPRPEQRDRLGREDPAEARVVERQVVDADAGSQSLRVPCRHARRLDPAPLRGPRRERQLPHLRRRVRSLPWARDSANAPPGLLGLSMRA